MDKIKKVDNESIDKKISLSLAAIFITLMGQYFILVIFNLFGTNKENIVQIISKLLVAMVFVYALPHVFHRSKKKIIVIYFISIFIILLNILLFNENIQYIKGLLFPIFFMSIPAFIYSLSINNIQILKIYIERASNIIFIMGTIITIMIFMGKSSIGVYSMSLSYYMLFPTIVYLNKLIDRISIVNCIYLIISIISIIALGSRGALMCIVFFLVLRLIKLENRFTLKILSLYITIISSSILIILFFKDILAAFAKYFDKFGIESRTIELLMREKLYLSGRDNIYEDLFIRLYDSPIIGIGIGSDRNISSGYAHNIFIEILCNFGVLIGLIIIVIILFHIFKSLIVTRYNDYNVVIFWLSVGFIHLFVSSSYLIDIKFWIMLGIVIRKFNNK